MTRSKQTTRVQRTEELVTWSNTASETRKRSVLVDAGIGANAEKVKRRRTTTVTQETTVSSSTSQRLSFAAVLNPVSPPLPPGLLPVPPPSLTPPHASEPLLGADLDIGEQDESYAPFEASSDALPPDPPMRIEIPFETFDRELLREGAYSSSPPSSGSSSTSYPPLSLLAQERLAMGVDADKIAAAVVEREDFKQALDLLGHEIRTTLTSPSTPAPTDGTSTQARDRDGSRRAENAFVGLLNSVMDLAPQCGLEQKFVKHKIVYACRNDTAPRVRKTHPSVGASPLPGAGSDSDSGDHSPLEPGSPRGRALASRARLAPRSDGSTSPFSPRRKDGDTSSAYEIEQSPNPNDLHFVSSDEPDEEEDADAPLSSSGIVNGNPVPAHEELDEDGHPLEPDTALAGKNVQFTEGHQEILFEREEEEEVFAIDPAKYLPPCAGIVTTCSPKSRHHYFHWKTIAIAISVEPASDASAKPSIEPGHPDSSTNVASYPTPILGVPTSMPIPTKTIKSMSKYDGEMPRWARECISRTRYDRRYAISMRLLGSQLRFYYFDRAGCIVTSPIDVLESPATLVGAVINLSLCTRKTLGMETACRVPLPEAKLKERLCPQITDLVFDIEGRRYQAEEVKLYNFPLYGRGEITINARMLNPDVFEPDDNAPNRAVNVTWREWWQPVTRLPDDALYLLAEERGVQGIQKLLASMSAGRLSEDVRGRMVPREMYGDQELRVQVLSTRYSYLCKVTNLTWFQKAFVSLLKIHHDLYEKTGILHRDISPTSLMVLAEDPTSGVLIGLDDAIAFARPCSASSGVPAAPAGCKKCRSIDLLGLSRYPQARPMSYYRHDLEAFYYCLVWLVIRFRGGKDQYNALEEWDSDGMRARQSKIAFVKAGDDILTKYPDAPLLRRWVLPLGKLIRDGWAAREAAQAEGNATFDHATLGGHITYENFMKVLSIWV